MLLNTWVKTDRRCPKCGTDRICRDRRKNRWEKIISLLNIYPYRCRQHHCKKRFYRFGRSLS